MQLRYYQTDAIKAVLRSLQETSENPCLEIPTGGGKTPIIATIATVIAKAGARVLIVAHRKELLEQTAEKLKVWGDDVPFSIVSAGLGQKDFGGRIVIAGIQSVFKHAEKLTASGPINFILVDEAHLIPNTDVDDVKGMYQTLIANLRARYDKLRVIGLTATPYRLGTGSVVGPDKILTKTVYKVGVKELIEKGYLCKLTTRVPSLDIDNSKLHIERGEYKAQDVDAQYNQKGVVATAVKNLIAMTRKRKSVLIFCASVEHANNVYKELKAQTSAGVAIVTGATDATERALTLKRFKREPGANNLLGDNSDLKYLINVDVLTTGFDATNVDAVVLLRPTLSPGLYYQMIGRGLRLNENKQDCLILDFAGNIEKHGPIDELQGTSARSEKGKAPTKVCQRCLTVIPAQSKTCPECGAIIVNDDYFCPRCQGLNDKRALFCMYCGLKLKEPKHETTAQTSFAVISGDDVPNQTEKVVNVSYSVHNSKTSGKETLRVDYQTEFGNRLTEFVCFNHQGFARHKADQWFKKRSCITPAPVSVKQAYYLAIGGYLAIPDAVVYKPKQPGEKYLELKDVVCNPKPEPRFYPRTNNPLAIACQSCGASSFCYIKEGDRYKIVCASCGTVFGVFDANNCGGVEGLRGELDAQRLNAGLDYVDPDKRFEVDANPSADTEKELADLFGASIDKADATGYIGDQWANPAGLPDDIPF